MAVFKGHNSVRGLQEDIMLFDVSWLMYVRYHVLEDDKTFLPKAILVSKSRIFQRLYIYIE